MDETKIIILDTPADAKVKADKRVLVLSDLLAEFGISGEPTGLKRADFDYYNDTVVLPFSSGTTGVPKGVELTHSNLIANGRLLIHCKDYGFITFPTGESGCLVEGISDDCVSLASQYVVRRTLFKFGLHLTPDLQVDNSYQF